MNLNIEELENIYEEKLSKVFGIKIFDIDKKIEIFLIEVKIWKLFKVKVFKLKVVILIFLGNNCEYDCVRVFEKEGVEVL